MHVTRDHLVHGDRIETVVNGENITGMIVRMWTEYLLKYTVFWITIITDEGSEYSFTVKAGEKIHVTVPVDTENPARTRNWKEETNAKE